MTPTGGYQIQVLAHCSMNMWAYACLYLSLALMCVRDSFLGTLYFSAPKTIIFSETCTENMCS